MRFLPEPTIAMLFSSQHFIEAWQPVL